MTKIETLLKTHQNIFTIDDLALLWRISDRARLWENIKYYLRRGRLHKLHQGVYALEPQYEPLQLAIKLFSPAYISFTTALGLHGAYFQYESEIHAMARASKQITLANGQTYVYHQLKADVLLNQQGVTYTDGYWLASLERAICDTSYLVPQFAFEHLDRADPHKLRQLAALYANKALEGRIDRLAREIEQEDQHA